MEGEVGNCYVNEKNLGVPKFFFDWRLSGFSNTSWKNIRKHTLNIHSKANFQVTAVLLHRASACYHSYVRETQKSAKDLSIQRHQSVQYKEQCPNVSNGRK
jgi:hypothetical protein